MDKETFAGLLKTIAETEGKEALNASKQILKNADDRVLRNEVINFQTAMISAKNSDEQDKVSDSLIDFMKDQMALIYIQAFRHGQGYQIKVDKEEFKKILEEAKNVGTVVEEDSSEKESGEK